MTKQEILDYVKGYYTSYRQTKNGLFIYSGIHKHYSKWQSNQVYTYISNEDINKKYAIEWIKEGLDLYMEDVKRFKEVELW